MTNTSLSNRIAAAWNELWRRLVADDSATSSTRFIQCYECGFWLSSTDSCCASCGRYSLHPSATWPLRALLRHVRNGILVGAASIVPLLAVCAAHPALSWSAAVGFALAFALCGAVLGLARGQDAVLRMRLSGRSRQCLLASERRVHQLIRANDARVAQVRDSSSVVGAILRGEDKSTSLAVLDSRRAARAKERHQYEAQLWDMAFARWVNSIQPLVADLETVSYAETKSRIQFATSVLDAGTRMREQWHQTPTASSEPGKTSIRQLDDALAGVRAVREELARRNALLADSDATHLRVPMPVGGALAHELRRFDQLNARLAAGEFSTAVDELERERCRLLGEAHVELDVDEILRLAATPS